MEPPPIIIRETKPKSKRQPKEDFIVIREAPPKEYLTKSAHELNYLREPPPVRQMPTNVRQGTGEAKRGRKTIRFLGYNFTLGPRKLIIERRQPSPEKPQSIIVERWLAPTSKQRRAVFRATPGQSAPFGRNSTIRNEKFDQDVVYDEIRLWALLQIFRYSLPFITIIFIVFFIISVIVEWVPVFFFLFLCYILIFFSFLLWFIIKRNDEQDLFFRLFLI